MREVISASIVTPVTREIHLSRGNVISCFNTREKKKRKTIEFP